MLNPNDPPSSKRKNDPQGLRQRVFTAALIEFAEFGLKGARLENIAQLADTTKRMVVYHFKNKETLYLAVLEYVYQHIRDHESTLALHRLPPAEAIVKLVEESFNYHLAHPDFIRLICMENMNRGKYISQSPQIRELNQSALLLLDEILVRGQEKQLFNDDVTAHDVHRLISSLCFHHVANQYTFNTLFESNSSTEEQTAHHRKMAVIATTRYLAR